MQPVVWDDSTGKALAVAEPEGTVNLMGDLRHVMTSQWCSHKMQIMILILLLGKAL